MPDSISQKEKDKVHLPSQKPFEEVSHVAIAICRTRANRFHAGMLYKDHGQCHLLHVPGDMSIDRKPPENEYLWVAPDIHPLRAPLIAGVCRLVWDENENDGIPFGFSDPRESFDKITGKFLIGNKTGLTCASFVLAIFSYAGFDLIDFDSWEKRFDDKEVFAELVDLIESHKICFNLTDDFIRQMRSEVENFRYRPEEVAGAGMLYTQENEKISYQVAVKYGEYVSSIIP